MKIDEGGYDRILEQVRDADNAVFPYLVMGGGN